MAQVVDLRALLPVNALAVMQGVGTGASRSRTRGSPACHVRRRGSVWPRRRPAAARRGRSRRDSALRDRGEAAPRPEDGTVCITTRACDTVKLGLGQAQSRRSSRLRHAVSIGPPGGPGASGESASGCTRGGRWTGPGGHQPGRDGGGAAPGAGVGLAGQRARSWPGHGGGGAPGAGGGRAGWKANRAGTRGGAVPGAGGGRAARAGTYLGGGGGGGSQLGGSALRRAAPAPIPWQPEPRRGSCRADGG